MLSFMQCINTNTKGNIIILNYVIYKTLNVQVALLGKVGSMNTYPAGINVILNAIY